MPKTQEQVILDVENLFHLTLVKSDIDGLVSICDPELMVTNELGVLLTSPTEMMENSPNLKVHSINVEERRVNICTCVAMVMTVEEHQFTLFGQRSSSRMRCNRIWKFNGKNWKLHVSTIHALA